MADLCTEATGSAFHTPVTLFIFVSFKIFELNLAPITIGLYKQCVNTFLGSFSVFYSVLYCSHYNTYVICICPSILAFNVAEKCQRNLFLFLSQSLSYMKVFMFICVLIGLDYMACPVCTRHTHCCCYECFMKCKR